MSMLICSTGAVMASWLNELFRVSIHAYESVKSELELHLPMTSTHPPVTRLEYAMGGYLLVKFKALVRGAASLPSCCVWVSLVSCSMFASQSSFSRACVLLCSILAVIAVFLNRSGLAPTTSSCKSCHSVCLVLC